MLDMVSDERCSGGRGGLTGEVTTVEIGGGGRRKLDATRFMLAVRRERGRCPLAGGGGGHGSAE